VRAGILAACKDKSASSSSLKIEALSFLRAALETNSPKVFTPHVQELSTGVFMAAAERYYKVAAEALRVCERLVPVLRQDPEEPVDAALAPIAQVGARWSAGCIWLLRR
jgi:cullin-associated NEDD8-dissociated protein 1